MQNKAKSKKGIFSFLYIFAIFTYLLVMLSIYLMIYEQISYLENKVFILEERVGRELEIKHAVKRVIIYSEQIKAIDKIASSAIQLNSTISNKIYSLYGVNRLNDLTSTGSHSYYKWRDFSLKFWCGFPSEAEIIEMISLKDKRPEFFYSNQIYNRWNVFNVDKVVIIDDEEKNLCSLFLSTNLGKSTTISKPDRKTFQKAFGPVSSLTYDIINVKYGVMIYDSKENISSAVIIPYSTEIIWDDILGLIK